MNEFSCRCRFETENSMKLIVAADVNGGIGYQGQLLVSIPLDQQRFRKETVGKVVVMGRKTLESLPQGQPLAERTNIVMTKNPEFRCKQAVVVYSMEEARREIAKYDSDDVYIVGGESIYRQFLPMADTVYMTAIDYAYRADAYFPKLEEEEWELEEESEEQTYFDLIYYFRTYRRKTAGR